MALDESPLTRQISRFEAELLLEIDAQAEKKERYCLRNHTAQEPYKAGFHFVKLCTKCYVELTEQKP